MGFVCGCKLLLMGYDWLILVGCGGCTCGMILEIITKTGGGWVDFEFWLQ